MPIPVYTNISQNKKNIIYAYWFKSTVSWLSLTLLFTKPSLQTEFDIYWGRSQIYEWQEQSSAQKSLTIIYAYNENAHFSIINSFFLYSVFVNSTWEISLNNFFFQNH